VALLTIASKRSWIVTVLVRASGPAGSRPPEHREEDVEGGRGPCTQPGIAVGMPEGALPRRMVAAGRELD